MRSLTLPRRALIGLLPGLLLAGWAGHAQAQSITPQNAARYFRSGRPVVSGYVYLNSSGLGAARVRLLVESLDAAGLPIAQEIAHVDSDLPFDGRTYFWVRPKNPGAIYRVTIHSGVWTRTVGGAGI